METKKVADTDKAMLTVIREAKKISMRRLAREAKTTHATISRIEAGKRNPSPELGKRISKALGANLELLFFERGGTNG